MQITIHRRQPTVIVGEKKVKLTKEEHSLLITLGMMDNRLTPHSLLVAVREDCRYSEKTMRQNIQALRKKMGFDCLKNNFGKGYILEGDVRFVE